MKTRHSRPRNPGLRHISFLAECNVLREDIGTVFERVVQYSFIYVIFFFFFFSFVKLSVMNENTGYLLHCVRIRNFLRRHRRDSLLCRRIAQDLKCMFPLCICTRQVCMLFTYYTFYNKKKFIYMI
jgi:hypothetical protein